MTKDTLETIGKVHAQDERRDAVHIAVEPVEAGERLKPGEHVTVERGVASGTIFGGGIGIVDPFLEEPVRTGERFWLFLYPRTITSLRHVWTHPGLPDESPLSPPGAKSEAEEWIRKCAKQFDLSYDDLMSAARTWVTEKRFGYGYLMGGEEVEYMQDAFDVAGFWPRYELVTGEPVPKDKQTGFFSCAC